MLQEWSVLAAGPAIHSAAYLHQLCVAYPAVLPADQPGWPLVYRQLEQLPKQQLL